MKKGDLVFCNDKLVGKVSRSVDLCAGEEWRVHLPRPTQIAATFDERDILQNTATFRPIFNLDGVRHWQMFLYGTATLEDAFNSGWIVPYEVYPSATPAGMVTALDLVLHELGPSAEQYQGSYLKRMREYFFSLATEGKTK